MSFNAIIRDRVKILKIISLPNSFIELIPLKFIKGLKTKFQCGDFFYFQMKILIILFLSICSAFSEENFQGSSSSQIKGSGSVIFLCLKSINYS